jgi:hypothetical protein
MKTVVLQKLHASHRWRIVLIGGLLGGFTVLGLLVCPAVWASHRDKPRATLRSLSTQAHVVSGGDVLIEV